MGEVTGIEWCDSTANVWKGCTKVSKGCDRCYAAELFGTEGNRYKDTVWGAKGTRIYVKAGWLMIRKFQRAAEKNGGVDPILQRRRRIFVNSLSDIFDNHKSVVWRDEFWRLVRECPDLIFILVTKRPGNMAKMLPPDWNAIRGRICLLVSVEDQASANMRLGHLYEQLERIPAPSVIGVSYEPAIGSVNFKEIHWQRRVDEGYRLDAMRGTCVPLTEGARTVRAIRPLQWVIMGGESGKGHRDMEPMWMMDTRAQCSTATVPFFAKQMAGKKPVPPGLMTRQFPASFDD